MTGVEILTSETIYNGILPEWCFIFGLIGIFIGAFCTAQLFIDCYENAPWIALAVTGVLLAITILSICPNKNNIRYIKYKITIDDSVSMNEFLDKYEILDQEGKIYTVKEK